MHFCWLCQMFVLLVLQGHARDHRIQLTSEVQPSAWMATNTSATCNFVAWIKKCLWNPAKKTLTKVPKEAKYHLHFPFLLWAKASLLWYDVHVLGHEVFNPSHRKMCCGSQRHGRPDESNKLCGTLLVRFPCLPTTSAQQDCVFFPGSFPAQPSLRLQILTIRVLPVCLRHHQHKDSSCSLQMFHPLLLTGIRRIRIHQFAPQNLGANILAFWVHYPLRAPAEAPLLAPGDDSFHAHHLTLKTSRQGVHARC